MFVLMGSLSRHATVLIGFSQTARETGVFAGADIAVLTSVFEPDR